MNQKQIKSGVKEIIIKDGDVTRIKKYNEKGLIVKCIRSDNKGGYEVIYDDKDNVINYLYDNGTKFIYEYDECGRKISYRSIRGDVISGYDNLYNEKGLVTETTFVGGTKVICEYDEFDNIKNKVCTLHDGSTTSISYNYDYKNLSLHIVTSRDNVIEEWITYNTNIDSNDLYSNILTYKCINNDGDTDYDYNNKYNDLQLLIETIDNITGIVTKYEYDENNKITKEYDSDGYIKQYFYNKFGKVDKVTDNRLGVVTENRYDDNGRRIYNKHRFPDGKIIEREYIYY